MADLSAPLWDISYQGMPDGAGATKSEPTIGHCAS